MKRALIAAFAIAVGGCQNTATDEMLIAKAKATAGMPDCNSMRVAFAYQSKSRNGYYLDTQFAASHSCMDEWRDRLADSGDFEGIKGMFYPKRSNEFDVIAIGNPRRNRGAVIWRGDEPFAGIELDKGLDDD